MQTFISAIITVGCAVEKYNLPATPAKADATYTIYDDRKYINFDTYHQYPPCDYPATQLLTWTIPKYAPIQQGNGDYQLQVRAQSPAYAGTYTVSLSNKITLGAQSWTYTFITSIYVVDPCLNTVIKSDATVVPDIKYELTKPVLLTSFKIMTDSFADSVATTYPSACGPINYIVRNAKTQETYSWAYVYTLTDPTMKAIAVQTNTTDLIGNYTMELVGSMYLYPAQTASKQFWLNITQFQMGLVSGVAVLTGTAPYLKPPVPAGTVPVIFGDSWTFAMTPLDADNDLQSINVKLGLASVFMSFDKTTNTLSIPRNSPTVFTGQFPISIELKDMFLNTNTYSFTLKVSCGAGKTETETFTCVDTPAPTSITTTSANG